MLARLAKEKALSANMLMKKQIEEKCQKRERKKNATSHYCHVIIRNNERRHLTQEERKKQCVNSTVDQQFNIKFSNTMDQNSRISSETEQKK